MRLYILGICGTFMGGLAALAREAGHAVGGADANVYPPMSTQLESLGIGLDSGYAFEAVARFAPDVVVVGNAVSRGNPALEGVLNAGLPYTSGPAWLAAHVLEGRPVLAVAGTHGKTTTTGLLAWLLEHAGLEPGFLVGGVPQNFGVSARLGRPGAPFVIEADEYDTAFCDKRSKFVHYRPRVAVLNNLEFDHADIFPDLTAIERQFHHLVRTVPANGRLIVNAQAPALDRVLAMGAWTPVERFDAAAGWHVAGTAAEGFRLREGDTDLGAFESPLAGAFNRSNALAAIAAARQMGVAPAVALAGLKTYQNVRRRLETVGTAAGVTVYDDFAHHPTAIAVTVAGLAERLAAREAGGGRLLAVLEPRSNTMKLGAHAGALAEALGQADHTFVYAAPTLGWDVAGAFAGLGAKATVLNEPAALVAAIAAFAQPGDHVLVMSNGGFFGVHRKLLDALAARG